MYRQNRIPPIGVKMMPSIKYKGITTFGVRTGLSDFHQSCRVTEGGKHSLPCLQALLPEGRVGRPPRLALLLVFRHFGRGTESDCKRKTNAPTLCGDEKWYERTGRSPKVPTRRDDEGAIDWPREQAFCSRACRRGGRARRRLYAQSLQSPGAAMQDEVVGD